MNTLAVIEPETRTDIALPGSSTGFGNSVGSELLPAHGFTNRAITQHEAETIQFHLSNARSKNTRLAYETQWRLFVAWCGQQGFLPFPAEVSTIVLYLDAIASTDCKYSKLEQTVSAIRAVHHDNMDLVPADKQGGLNFRHPHIKATLASIQRSMVEKGLNTVKKPRAFSQDEILRMVHACPNTPSGIQDRAILLLGVNVGLRASEFVALELADLTFDDMGVDVRIRSSKTDQFGQGEHLFIGRLAPSMQDYDAVKAMESWLRIRATLDVGELSAVFVAFRKGGHVLHRTLEGQAHRLTREAISSVVQRCASRAGIEITNQTVSSHGMRHSFITQGFNRGVDAVTIAKTSRHKSMTVLLGYDQSSRRGSTVAPKLWI
jgi:site-specific recombinase XerD